MRPPIALPDPANPPFTVVNDAKAFDPFDPVALNWDAASAPAARDAALAKFRLGLQYTATQAVGLFSPTVGEVSWIATSDGGQIVSRTLVLTLGPEAIKELHFAGRVENDPEPAAVSAFPWSSVYGSAVRVRVLFTFAGASLDERLRTQIAALYAADILHRGCDPAFDLRFVDGELTPVALPDSSPQTHLEAWWSGESAAPWRIKGADAQNKLVDLQANDVVLLQAQLRDGLARSASDHWYLCNVGLVLRSLALAGDPADSANDDAYRVMCGDCFAPIMSGGTVASGGTNPSAESRLGFTDVVVVHGGSQGGALLQPPPESVVPGCVFSFTTAEDVSVFAPALEDKPLALRLWQPTYDILDLGMVKTRVATAGVNAAAVWVPPGGTVILTTEYYAPGRATSYPDKRDSVFLPEMERGFSYDGTRARPAEGQPPHVIAALSSWARSFNINETAEIRPEHPRWRTKAKGVTFATVRRIFPLRVEMRLGNTSDAPPLCTISQDEIDCVRQEYIFHMQFTDYYQDYAVLWNAAERATRVFPSPTHRIVLDAQQRPTLPALGVNRVIKVPTRRQVRPVTTPIDDQRRYHYTLLMANFQDRIDEVAGLAEGYAKRIRAILASAALQNAVRTAMAAGNDFIDVPPAGDPVLPPYAAEVTVMALDLLAPGAVFPGASVSGFLRDALTTQNALTRFAALAPYALQLGSSWRPPEHNESPSKTPLSNHQIGEAFDKQPRGSGGGARNPLAQLCLHLVGQDLFPGRLREMLLENQAAEYLSRSVDPAKRSHVVIANPLAGGGATFRLRAPNGTEEDLPTQSEMDGEPLDAKTISSNLGTEFLDAYAAYLLRTQISAPAWPVPPPTYLEVYLFGLTVASHVHFTWRIP